MSVAVKLSEDLVEVAKKRARVEHRSAPKQIELWAEIGRAALDNPELPVQFIIDTLYSLHEAKEGLTEPYEVS